MTKNYINDSKHGMSIVVPFLNESEGIFEFCKTIDKYALSAAFPIELVFVDDGSTDDSIHKIREYALDNISKVQLIKLSKNFGSHAAIRAGLTKCSYDICTWMGSDLQEPLELINMSYDLINSKELDAVYVEKKSIKVSKLNRRFSKAYSSLMRKYAVKNYSSGGISTIVFNKKILEFVNNNIEGNSSIMLQIMDAGYRYEVISLDYNERFVGTSKWTLSKKIKLFIDSFVSFSFMPIRLVSIVGVIVFIIGVIIGLTTVVNAIFNPEVPIGYSTLASIMAIGFGITNISLGIIAEYLWRAYDAARNRPVYIVSDSYVLKQDE
ncbi:MAG: glycosyltransferase [Holdemanella sp.]|nr:glycosyltransferase [Holdemanella sp.]